MGGNTQSRSGNYELINDNLADIAHTEFVHPSTLGNEAMRAARGSAVPASVPQFDASLVAGGMDFHLLLTGTAPAPSFVNAFNRVHGAGTEEALDFQLDFSFRAPAFRVFSPAVKRSGTQRKDAVGSSGLTLVTPENGGASHYFHKICQNYAPDSEAETRYWLDETCRAFDEDKVVLEAQQSNMQFDDPDGQSQLSFRRDSRH